MRWIISSSVLFFLWSLPLSAMADDQILGGIAGLACEAKLCLSSSVRPSECSRSLDYYYSIKKKHWSDTLRKRQEFLNKCPSASSESMPSVEELMKDLYSK